MSDSIPEAPSESLPVACPHCESQEVRPSRSSYPQDRDKIGAEAASFWRCGNCGARFLGPFTVEPAQRRHARSSSKEPKSTLDRDVQFTRQLKRWLFPVLVILATVIAVIYLLDKQDAPQQQIVTPN